MRTIYRGLILLLLLFAYPCLAQDIVGKWKTIDDEDGKPRSIVEIYKQGEKYFGKIVEIFYRPGEPTDPVCNLCTDERKGKKSLAWSLFATWKRKAMSSKGAIF